MSFDESLAFLLDNADCLNFSLILDDKTYPMRNVVVTKSTNPVDGPTTRGGVYTTDKVSFKIKGDIEDVSIIPKLSKNMLGPNTDFGELEVKTTIKSKPASIITHLTNTMHNSEKVELNLVIVKIN